MLKKNIKYVDYDGNARAEDFYFNLNKAEVIELQLGTVGGLTKTLEKIVQEKDTSRIIEYFKTIILKAYGEKSADGRRFIKSQELRDAFEQKPTLSCSWSLRAMQKWQPSSSTVFCLKKRPMRLASRRLM